MDAEAIIKIFYFIKWCRKIKKVVSAFGALQRIGENIGFSAIYLAHQTGHLIVFLN